MIHPMLIDTATLDQNLGREGLVIIDVRGKAAYAFIENPRADLQFPNLLAPHQSNTRRRMAAENVVVLAQDTSALSYNTLHQTQGLGIVGET